MIINNNISLASHRLVPKVKKGFTAGTLFPCPISVTLEIEPTDPHLLRAQPLNYLLNNQ